MAEPEVTIEAEVVPEIPKTLVINFDEQGKMTFSFGSNKWSGKDITKIINTIQRQYRLHKHKTKLGVKEE